jgi:nicotinate phosphoribosyltransferase
MDQVLPLDGEIDKFSKISFIKNWYVEYLRSYRYNPSEVSFEIDSDGNMDLVIKGKWHRTILWEVPLMALISECFFALEKEKGTWSMEGQSHKLELKENILMSGQCKYADFGTRRRRSYEVQDMVVSSMKKHHWFAGTSNVHLAFKYDVRPIGTMAHEWVQGISALESVNQANRFMLKKWVEVYNGSLGIALTDTYGLDSFLEAFDAIYAKLYDGVRHDSGDPFKFADRIVAHYKLLGISHKSKVIVFSDGLTAQLAKEIQEYCDKLEIQCSFGIGTSFTNDFDDPALNMVIKLWRVNGFPVVKLSDNPAKANGEPAAVAAVRYLYGV